MFAHLHVFQKYVLGPCTKAPSAKAPFIYLRRKAGPAAAPALGGRRVGQLALRFWASCFDRAENQGAKTKTHTHTHTHFFEGVGAF